MDRSELVYIRILNDKINEQLERIDFLKSKTLPGAIRYDDIGGSRSMVCDTLGDIFAEIDLEERLTDELIDKRHALKEKAVKCIQRYCDDPAERHVLYLRYLGTLKNADVIEKANVNLEWSEVIEEMNKRHNIQRSRVYDLHHIALSKLKHHNM